MKTANLRKTTNHYSLRAARLMSFAILVLCATSFVSEARAQEFGSIYIGEKFKRRSPRTEMPQKAASTVAKAGENLSINTFVITDPADPTNPQPTIPGYFDFSSYIELTIDNAGDAITTPFIVSLEFVDQSGYGYTYFLGETVVNGVPAGAVGMPVSISSVYIPFSELDFSLFGDIGVFLDNNGEVAETNEADNYAASNIGVSPPGPSNLEVLEFSTTQSELPRVQDLASLVTLRVRNNSDNIVPMEKARINLLLSEDAIVDSTDTYLQTIFIPWDLLPGQTVDIDYTGQSIPYTAKLGSTFLGVILDRFGLVLETNENDNDAVVPVTIVDNTTAECVYAEDFQGGEASWTTTSVSDSPQEVFFNQTTYDDGGVPRGVFWCGTTNPSWVDPEGYGNFWDQRLTKTFALPTGAVSFDYSLQFDTEPGYDFVRVELWDAAQQLWILLREHNGTSLGFEVFSEDLTAYAGQTVDLRFRFTSDGGWSDQDGLYVSNGACRIDYAVVTGFLVDGFDSSDNGWVASFPPPDAQFAFRLEEEPLCYSTVDPAHDCNFYTNGDPAVTCNAWVAYDPLTGRYPVAPQSERVTEIGVVSPIFEVPADATTFILVFDIMSDLPISNGIFYRYAVSSPGGGEFQPAPFIFYGVQGGWITRSWDISDLVTPGTTAQIRLSAYDAAYIYGAPGYQSAAPMFDNVRLLAFNGNGTGESCPSPRECGSVTIVTDSDLDGVPDDVDLCPNESGAPFDGNGDGCRDELAGARHIEYWEESEFPLHYVINEAGAPGVGASAFDAVQSALDSWGADPLTEVSFVYDGPTPQRAADALDGINLVTFTDQDFPFPSAVLAVGLSTSFVEPAEFQGRLVRPGEIVDFDLIFNPDRSFKTDSEGPAAGSDIQAVAVHEAGHALGMAHASIPTSTMFYVLPENLDARSLELDDAMAMRKAYPAPSTLDTHTRIVGTVVGDNDGVFVPAPGVIVFAHDTTDLRKLACEYTLPDGSFQFVGLPAGDYFISIHGLDGTEDIGFIRPGNINQLIADTAFTTVVPEFYDAAESKGDDEAAMTPVTALVVSPPATPNPITIILNVDEVGPLANSEYPTTGSTDVAIDAPVRVRFSEAIDDASISGNFRLTSLSDGAFISGNAAIFEDGTLLSFVPGSTFAFETDYRLEILGGITDIFGNTMQAPLTVDFTTQVQPAVSITSLSPIKGVAGTIVVVAGAGFEEGIEDNELRIDGVPVALTSATASQAVFTVPEGTAEGILTVVINNRLSGLTSNELSFSVIAPLEVARGFEADAVALGGSPRAISVSGDGSKAFMATDAGFSSVNVDAGSGTYLTHTALTIGGGLSELDETPDASLVFAVSRTNEKIYRIATGPLESDIAVLNEQALEARPRGILVDPSGRRAFIPTNDAGRIIVWDVNEASPTFDQPLQVLESGDPNIRGKMAMDPTGAHLYLLTGTGKLLDFDLSSETVVGEVSVGLDPVDLVVNRTGSRAFVSTGDGHVAIVDLSSFTRVFDVRTGGTLLGIDIAAAGSFVYAVNHDLDKLDVIDLQPTSPALLTVATRIDQQVNPLDVELSSDGLYAYSIVETSQQLIVNSIGLGPALGALSLKAGPVGSKLVLSGDALDDDDVTTVSFNGITVVPENLTPGSLTVTVPTGASSGPVLVVGTNGSEQTSVSNSLAFAVLGASEGTSLRLGGSSPGAPSPSIDAGSVMARAVAGDQLVLADLEGGFHVFDLDTTSESFNSFLGTWASGSQVTEISLSPDGALAYVLLSASSAVRIVDVNRRSSEFLTQVASVDLSALSGPAAGILLSSDGRELLVSDPGGGQVHVVDLDPESLTPYSLTGAIVVSDPTVNGRVGEMAMHPAGSLAYLPVQDSDPAVIRVVDMDASSPTHHTVVATYLLPGSAPQPIPTRIEFTPSGDHCLVLTREESASSVRTLLLLDTSTPLAPSLASQSSLGTAPTAPAPDDLAISPRSDRAVVSVRGVGLFNYELQASPAALIQLEQMGDPANHAAGLELEYAADGSALHALAASTDQLLSYDFLTVQSMTIVGGDAQTGVVDQALPGELRVEVRSASDPTQGVPVTFTVTGGGGSFTLSGLTTQTVLTDVNGIADIDFSLGPDLGLQTVEASSFGVVNSPLGFSFTALEDPETIPMTVVSVSPAPGALGVSVSTAVLVVFSRGVDIGAVSPASFRLLENGTELVPAVIGFADGNRRVSITPSSALSNGTSYTLEISGVTDASGGLLVGDPYSSIFTTAPPLPIALYSISPPSARRNTPVTLSGRSFEPGANVVRFGSVEAVISSESANTITLTVPLGLASGSYPVEVQTSSETSLPLDFVVLEPKTSPVDDVLASAHTGSSTRAVTITPDGTLAYAVSPDANLVIPIIFDGSLTPLPAIPVGESPYAITMHPDGLTAYVSNLISGSVSVIDTDPTSPTYHSVIEEIGVGVGPMDLVVAPDGDRLIVANAGSKDLSVVDSDAASSTYHQVLATAKTGASTRTVTISPDGTRLYAGTEDGYIVLSTLDFGVLSSARTGSSTRQVTVSPDGTLLVVLSTEGQIFVFDVAPGSATEDQVLASTRGGTTTRSVTVSPDGTLLYAVQNELDVIFVYSLEFEAGVSVLAADSIIDGFGLEVVATVETGENPAWVAFDPSGETNNILVTNSGDNTVTLLGTPVIPTIVYLEGQVTADCPSPGTPLAGVEVDVYATVTGDLVGLLETDENGNYATSLDPGEYVVTVVTPLAYTIEFEEQHLLIDGTEAEPTRAEFPLLCETVPPNPRKMSFWKHQLGLNLLGQGQPDIDAATLCGYLDIISEHFNNHRINPVVTYVAPASGLCQDKLQVAKDLLNLRGKLSKLAQARQELLAMLFNVSSQHVSLTEVISMDGARVSHAITYVDRLIDDGDPANDHLAWIIGKDINKGKRVDAGVIPTDLPDIQYKDGVPVRFELMQNYPNPFNPITRIFFALPQKTQVGLVIYDTAGRRVRVLINEEMGSGLHQVLWDGQNERGRRVASGVYFYRLLAGDFEQTKKMLLVK